MERKIILNKLLNKYENSKHLTAPGMSKRRVMLRIEKSELPEYQYEVAQVRDAFNKAAKSLEAENLVKIEWQNRVPVIKSIILNLEQISAAYEVANREHPRQKVKKLCTITRKEIQNVQIPWIREWKESICSQMELSLKLPSAFRQGIDSAKDLLSALKGYDSLKEKNITMRTFSSLCFSDTKYFERFVRNDFLKVAEKFCPELSEACENSEIEKMNWREQLAVLGIYAHPELFEAAGDFAIVTGKGIVDFSPLSKTGVALPCNSVNYILRFDIKSTKSVIFIENKTNYDEFVLHERKSGVLAVYHGGFFGPQKQKMFSKLFNTSNISTQFFFWADIDIGGFRMFDKLHEIIPTLQPLWMTAADVDRFANYGLKRSQEYLDNLKTELDDGKFPLFIDAAKRILYYGKTIEQEIFLSQVSNGS